MPVVDSFRFQIYEFPACLKLMGQAAEDGAKLNRTCWVKVESMVPVEVS